MFYDKARERLPGGVDEVIFLNEYDHLCEGSITSIFVMDKKGLIKTPPCGDGLLPGILRQSLLLDGKAIEQSLTLADLDQAKNIYVGNALRGLIPARIMDLDL